MNRQSAAGAAPRCRSCGALATADADWCGQCFASLHEPPAADLPPEPDLRQVETKESLTQGQGAPTWPCPACGERNDIDRDVCGVCGTSFAALMRQDEGPRTVAPGAALGRSLIFPGLGHRLCGYPLDGLARGVLFGMIAIMTILVGLSGTRSASLKLMFLLFCVLAVLVYVGSAYEAHGLASGGQMLVTSKQILWATVAVVMLSVGMLAMSVITTPRP